MCIDLDVCVCVHIMLKNFFSVFFPDLLLEPNFKYSIEFIFFCVISSCLFFETSSHYVS